MNELTPTLLLILNGWGLAPEGSGNAVRLAAMPKINALLQKYPSARLTCSGRAVGLPYGFMGNSEVGHMNIGAGRIVYQDMTRIDLAVENHEFEHNPAINGLIDAPWRKKAVCIFWASFPTAGCTAISIICTPFWI